MATAQTNEDRPASRAYFCDGDETFRTESHSSLNENLILPDEALADLILAGEEALAKGLKLEYLKKPVLWNLCLRRGLSLPQKPTKTDMANALEEWVSLSSRVINVTSISCAFQRGGQPLPVRKSKHTMKVVLGRNVLSEVASDMTKLMLPRWVDPAPKRVGHKKQGKLSADQWRSFCTIHLPITLIRLWGHLSPDERWYRMLVNFLDLVLAVELGSMMVTSPEHAAAFESMLTRYLVGMKELYKEAVVAPTHHLALHIPDFLNLWGPSPQARGFGWERFNHMLQGINTNMRFGEYLLLQTTPRLLKIFKGSLKGRTCTRQQEPPTSSR